MPKGQSDNNRGRSLPNLEIEGGFNLNRSTENINREIDREDTSIEATHENCDTTIEIREGGLRGLIMGRTEKTEIDCEPEDEIEPPSSSESFFPEANEQPEMSNESRESEDSFLLESQSESFLESEPEREVESEFESTFC